MVIIVKNVGSVGAIQQNISSCVNFWQWFLDYAVSHLKLIYSTKFSPILYESLPAHGNNAVPSQFR